MQVEPRKERNLHRWFNWAHTVHKHQVFGEDYSLLHHLFVIFVVKLSRSWDVPSFERNLSWFQETYTSKSEQKLCHHKYFSVISLIEKRVKKREEKRNKNLTVVKVTSSAIDKKWVRQFAFKCVTYDSFTFYVHVKRHMTWLIVLFQVTRSHQKTFNILCSSLAVGSSHIK